MKVLGYIAVGLLSVLGSILTWALKPLVFLFFRLFWKGDS